MLTGAKEYLADLLHLFYPEVCLACSQPLLKDEKVICFKCESELPQTGYWLDTQNPLMQRLWGRVPVKGAAAFLQFRKGGSVQHLLHQMKYRGRKEVGEYLGHMFGQRLKQENSVINNVDLVVPVPLHWKKLKTRGYNQCDAFAQGIADTIGAPCSFNAIDRVLENTAQARKRKYDRWENVSGIFSLADIQQIEGKHVLVVDDVVTTGATAEACMHAILTAKGSSTSFLSIAVALQ